MKTQKRKEREIKANYLYNKFLEFGFKVVAVYFERYTKLDFVEFLTCGNYYHGKFVVVLKNEEEVDRAWNFLRTISLPATVIHSNCQLPQEFTLLWNEEKNKKYLRSLNKQHENKGI